MVPLVFTVLFAPLQNTCLYYLSQGKTSVSNSKWISDSADFDVSFKKIQKAEKALKFYKGFKGKGEPEENAINDEFERLKSVAMKQNAEDKFQASNVCEYLILPLLIH